MCNVHCFNIFQSTPSAWRETIWSLSQLSEQSDFNPLPPHGGRPRCYVSWILSSIISIHSLRMEGDFFHVIFLLVSQYFNPLPPHGGRPPTGSGRHQTNRYFNPLPPHGGRQQPHYGSQLPQGFQSTPSAWRETAVIVAPEHAVYIFNPLPPHGGRQSKTAQESVFHFAYPCTILQKRMQKTTFCTRKNGFFRKKGEKFGAKPSASFCAPMIRTDTFPLNFSHRISGSSMSMVSFAPICSTFD